MEKAGLKSFPSEAYRPLRIRSPVQFLQWAGLGNNTTPTGGKLGKNTTPTNSRAKEPSAGPCDAPNFRGSFFFSYKSSMYFSFTYPKYMKLYCSNIFLQKAAQGHNPTFFLLTASREHRLLVYLKRGGGGVPRRGEQSSVVIISYKGYSPPKCTCNDCIENTFK